MLHILWLIIKVILILLGILLGLVLLAILLLLFCPVRYRGKIKKQKEDKIKETQIFGEVSWLFRGISVRAFREKDNFKTEIRLFGVPLSRIKGLFSKEKKRPESTESGKKEKSTDAEKIRPVKKVRSEEESPAIKTSPEPKMQEEKESPAKKNIPTEAEESFEEKSVWQAEEEEQIPEQEEMTEEEKQLRRGISDLFFKIAEKIKTAVRSFLNFFQKIGGIPGKISRKIGELALSLRKFRDKIDGWKDFIDHPRTRAALSLLWKDAKKLIHHIWPTRVTGKVVFGSEDPAVTGTVLAVLGMSIPFHKNAVAVTPLFDGENTLEGEVMLKGRIYGVILLKTAAELYFNKNIKYVIHRWRHKEVNHGERE